MEHDGRDGLEIIQGMIAGKVPYIPPDDGEEGIEVDDEVDSFLNPSGEGMEIEHENDDEGQTNTNAEVEIHTDAEVETNTDAGEVYKYILGLSGD